MAIILRSRVASVAPTRYDNIEALEAGRRLAGIKPRKAPKLVPTRDLVCRGKHDSLYPSRPNGRWAGVKSDWSNRPKGQGASKVRIFVEPDGIEGSETYGAMTYAFRKAQERKQSIL